MTEEIARMMLGKTPLPYLGEEKACPVLEGVEVARCTISRTMTFLCE